MGRTANRMHEAVDDSGPPSADEVYRPGYPGTSTSTRATHLDNTLHPTHLLTVNTQFQLDQLDPRNADAHAWGSMAGPSSSSSSDPDPYPDACMRTIPTAEQLELDDAYMNSIGAGGGGKGVGVDAGGRIEIACSMCRRRKTKCDGVKPRCGNCMRRKDGCVYEAVPKRRGPDRKPGTRIRTVYSKRLLLERGGVLPPQLSKRERMDPNVVAAAVARRKKSGSVDNLKRGARGAGGNMEGMEEEMSEAREESGSGGPSQSPTLGDEVKDEQEGYLVPKVETEVDLYFSGDYPSYDSDLEDVSGSSIYTLADEGSQLALTELDASVDGSEWQEESLPTNSAYITELPDDQSDDSNLEIISPPSVQFSRKTWWDSLLELYSPDRAGSIAQVQMDIAYVFSFSPYFLSFINVPLFWSTFHNPVSRDTMQPSFVIGLLAFTTFMRSSELGGGVVGRRRAVELAGIARSYFQASLNAGWVDPTLAQAAFILTLFEMCPHPDYSFWRLNSSYCVLDNTIAMLSLTSMDAQDAQAVVFAPSYVPSVSAQHKRSPLPPCSCSTLALCATNANAERLTPFWSHTPAWDPEWSETEIRREECRRLCWNTLNIASGHTSVSISFGRPVLDFHCTRPENYALLFPGETLARSSKYTFTHSPRDSVWSVYGRLALLYGSCWRMMDSEADPQSKVEFAYKAWLETLELEEILNSHVCHGERSTLFQGREFIFKIRVLVSRDYRNYFPFPETGIDLAFHYKKAEQWLSHQASLAQRLMEGMNSVTGLGSNDLRLRPFLMWYFALQSQRCLQFYEMDPHLKLALDVASAWVVPIEYLRQIWPCPHQEVFFDMMKNKIANLRSAAGMQPFTQKLVYLSSA